MSDDRWAEGETVVLKSAGTPPVLVALARGPVRIGEDAVVDLTAQIGAAPGGAIEWLGRRYRVLRPSLADLLATVRRGAQIVTPKDAVQLLHLAGVRPGGRVAEAGAGSGALTIALAFAVGPEGRVTSFDRRRDFLDAARGNVERAGLAARVDFRERDVAREGLEGIGYDSVLLDLPEPWAVLASARASLRVGGHVATYTPTYNQLERTVNALRAEGFDEVRAVEIWERALHVGEGGTRPSFDMLGHTGFLAAGRRVD
ncbi:MAG TPA: methyltransferase domain-containing protein [Thermoplasmata archaeon]|nr:methyltransferase domain-containing protein [Thermoplasmata archaeon]